MKHDTEFTTRFLQNEVTDHTNKKPTTQNSFLSLEEGWGHSAVDPDDSTLMTAATRWQGRR